ncbi:serine protease family protein [Rhizobium ruizarguesonis]|uniref:hypothetical protein n=1 Tax=Rhizobium ruizarguesonis TaxID=2081791 RepID=UPI0010302B71|nr:hypothetical protein [Rhizobium ruizarguesonis]TBB88077.1 hypothetical protein ELH41_15165 [Rhizobium ruizarguesonis]TBC45033.1 hypothetical protein ELH31_15285 [Rhizobium ruizarguesonis]
MSEETTPAKLLTLNAVRQHPLESANAKEAVVRVGYGRGFVAKTVHSPVIITCAHCLPNMPPSVGGIMMTEEKTYPRLVGALGDEPSITVECLFADPVADVAVLGEPDWDILWKEAEAYHAFVEDRKGLPLALEQNAAFTGVQQRMGAWLTLEDRWVHCGLAVTARSVLTSERAKAGMSGSPIILDTVRRTVVGVVSSTEFHPRLAAALPAWLSRQLVMR